MQTNPLSTALDAVAIGPEVTFENLTMVPLLRKIDSRIRPKADRRGAPDVDRSVHLKGVPADGDADRPGGPRYVMLDDALASGAAEITELSEQGSVPELRFVNRGTTPVLIIDGQELLGAKQNRVVNLTILAPAGTTLTIPVSCVESGRWSARSRGFSAAPRTQYASGRGKRVAQVTKAILDRGVPMSDQAAVWADIAHTSARLKAPSSTGAMKAIFDRHAAFIDRCVDAFEPLEGQIGAMFVVNASIAGLDLFDDATTLRRVLPKLVRAAAVDALDRSSESRADSKVSTRACELFLAHLSTAAQHSARAVGLGEDVRLSSPSIAGAALVVDDAIVHLSAFASV
jgi:hypothetical protein